MPEIKITRHNTSIGIKARLEPKGQILFIFQFKGGDICHQQRHYDVRERWQGANYLTSIVFRHLELY